MSFHVPESARDTTHPQLGTTTADGNNGAFDVESPEPGWRLTLICSDCSDGIWAPADQWEHVSVHAYRSGKKVQLRTPTWKEMSFVKDLCWDGEDVVMQLHPKKSEYVNLHPHVLHLWRPVHGEILTPPPIFVGPPKADQKRALANGGTSELSAAVDRHDTTTEVLEGA